MLQTITSSEGYIILAVFAVLTLVALIYLLSPPPPMSLLEDVTIRGAEIRRRIRELLARGTFTTDTRTVLVVGAADQALEHHEAIWLLRESNVNGSAMAMIRLVWDAMFRAVWFDGFATNEQVELAAHDELDWQHISVRNDIKRGRFGTIQDSEKAAKLDKVFGKEFWKIPNSYTHTGRRQLARRFSYDQVKPSYTEHELAQGLSAATEALLSCFVVLLKNLQWHEEADEIALMYNRYHAEFDERLHSGK